MKKSIFTLIVSLLVLSINFLQAQDLNQILDRHFKAIGQEKLSKVKTYSVEATIDQMGMELPMEMKMKRPNKFRMEMQMKGQKLIQVYNGKVGWVLAPWVNPKPVALEGDELQQALDQADIDGELYNYEQKGSKAKLIGKEQLDGYEVYDIELTTKNGDIKNYYIDAESYLITQAKAKAVSNGQEVNITQKMLDYKDFDGIKLATRIVSETPMGNGEVILKNIQFNKEINDSIFEKPSE